MRRKHLKVRALACASAVSVLALVVGFGLFRALPSTSPAPQRGLAYDPNAAPTYGIELEVDGLQARPFLEALDMDRYYQAHPELDVRSFSQARIFSVRDAQGNRLAPNLLLYKLPLTLPPGFSAREHQLLSLIEWEEDGASVLEFRSRTPFTNLQDLSEALVLSGRLGNLDVRDWLHQPFRAHHASLHGHISLPGTSLRTTAALLNLDLAFRVRNWGPRVTFRSVEQKGFLRLYESDRLELRALDPSGLLPAFEEVHEVSLRPRERAQSLLRRADLAAAFSRLIVTISRRPNAHDGSESDILLATREHLGMLTALGESLRAMDSVCPGCTAEEPRLIAALTAAIGSPNPQLQLVGAWAAAHLEKLPAPLQAASARRLESFYLENLTNPNSEARLRFINAARNTVDPSLQGMLRETIQDLPPFERNRFLGATNELDTSVIRRWAVESLARADFTHSNSPDLPLLQLAVGLPNIPEARSQVWHALRYGSSPARVVAMTTFLATHRYLDASELAHLEEAMLPFWNSSRPLREIAIHAAPPGIMSRMLELELRIGNGLSPEMLLAFRGPSATPLQATLSRLIRAPGADLDQLIPQLANLDRIDSDVARALEEIPRSPVTDRIIQNLTLREGVITRSPRSTCPPPLNQTLQILSVR